MGVMAKYADTKRCFIAVTLRFLGDVLPVTAETLGCWIRDERSKDKYPSLRLGLGSSLRSFPGLPAPYGST